MKVVEFSLGGLEERVGKRATFVVGNITRVEEHSSTTTIIVQGGSVRVSVLGSYDEVLRRLTECS